MNLCVTRQQYLESISILKLIEIFRVVFVICIYYVLGLLINNVTIPCILKKKTYFVNAKVYVCL